MLTAVNTGRAGWEQVLSQRAGTEKKRVNILAIGDVGSTLLTGLKLLGGDVISSIGICDLSDQITARWEFEMGQISLPWDYRAFPKWRSFPWKSCLTAMCSSCGLPGHPAGGLPGEGRAHGPVRKQRRHCEAVRPHGTGGRLPGAVVAVSDPVDPLAKTAYLESNRDENGVWDGKGLRPEQIQGFGLGVMNARAAYFAKRDPRLASFLTEGALSAPTARDCSSPTPSTTTTRRSPGS